jgi:hypothetical protein
MYRAINADYYGFRDEEDGVLVQVEAGAEAGMRQQVGPAGGGPVRDSCLSWELC